MLQTVKIAYCKEQGSVLVHDGVGSVFEVCHYINMDIGNQYHCIIMSLWNH